MKTSKHVFLTGWMIILSVIACSCDTRSSPTVPVEDTLVLPSATKTKTPTKVSPLLSTHTPTNNKTPTLFPSLSPTPTWSFGETKDKLLDLYENNRGCKLPCWWGIEPGSTKWETAKEILEPFALQFYHHLMEPGLTFYEVYVKGEDPDYYYRRQIYTVNNGVVEEIEVNISQLPTYSFLKFMFQNYGQPDEIYLLTGRLDENQVKTDMILAVLYQKQGIFAWYSPPVAEIRKDEGIIYGCPQYPDSGAKMILWHPEEMLSFEEISQHMVEGPPDGSYKPLDEATGISIAEYYDEVMSHPYEACLITPIDIWEQP